MKFTDTPTRLMRVRYGGPFPGLGHQITTLCYVLKYCQANGLYPVLRDNPDNAYGSWTDHFEAFWDKAQRRRIMERASTLEVVDSELKWVASRAGLFGNDWTRMAHEIKAIFLDIFVLRDPVRQEIRQRIDRLRLPPGYATLHVRRGDKNRQFKDYGALSDKEIVRKAAEALASHRVEDVFVLTDDYRIVEEIRDSTSMNVLTLCRENYLGHDSDVRNAPGHTKDLLTEIHVAVDSEVHFQTVRSRVSKVIRLLRDDRNCHHLFEEGYTQYTAL